jgi:DNA-binding CsgD family transcriptional regulator
MNMPVNDILWGLTEKEKQTLRLIVRGHDAKSAARSLGLSVHTINERLREARRKMAVSSSREAARILFDAEGEGVSAGPPNFLGDTGIGEDAVLSEIDQAGALFGGAGRAHRRLWIITGVLLMSIAFGLLALATLSHVSTTSPSVPASSASPESSEVVQVARQWLTLIDQGRWEESYRGTGSAFQKLNSGQVWAATNEKVRVPLGAVLSRTFLRQENLPAPPHGYEVVKFRTSFANKADAIETVSLSRQDGSWRVAGVTIE